MEEKLIGTKEEANVEKKVYTAPTLTVYGKLTDLTAGGSQGNPEQQPFQDHLQRP
jgi:hypothetical protein